MWKNALAVIVLVFFATACGNDAAPVISDGGTADTDTDTDTDADGDTDADSDTDADTDTDSDGGVNPGELIGTIRDFHDTHPDFEAELGAETGIVEDVLGSDGKPVYAGGAGTVTTHGEAAFDQWYNDTVDVNMSTQWTIQLVEGTDGVWVFDDQEFFPIDGMLFGEEGNPHNYHFTYELHTQFTYNGGEVFRFTGDDDLWVFINNRLAIDLGGVHGQLTQEADLDDQAADLGISTGNVYTLDFFFAERHLVESHFRIDTTISDLAPPID